MDNAKKAMLKAKSPYNAVITREQFLFYELRTTAKLVTMGLSNEEIIVKIVKENLYQYPTEKSLKRMARTCLRRLDILNDDSLVEAIATKPSDLAKQISLYAMMKQYRLIWDFFITVIGEKYGISDLSLEKLDINSYFLRLQEQDDWVATWSEATITKLKQVIFKILLENGYIDTLNPNKLNQVYLHPFLEEAIRKNGDEIVLPAFNCIS